MLSLKSLMLAVVAFGESLESRSDPRTVSAKQDSNSRRSPRQRIVQNGTEPTLNSSDG